jgi:hypothetical protein
MTLSAVMSAMLAGFAHKHLLSHVMRWVIRVPDRAAGPHKMIQSECLRQGDHDMPFVIRMAVLVL